MKTLFSAKALQKVRIIFYFLLTLLLLGVGVTRYKIASYSKHNPTFAEIGGDDRVVWKNTPSGIIAEDVHPLLGYQQQAYIDARIPEYLLKDDRLKKIDYIDIYKAGIVDTITRNAHPGKVFIFQIERKNKQAFTTEMNEPFVVNAYRLTFSFNERGDFWRITLWVTALGLFGIILIVLILFPLIQGKKTENRLLRSLEISAIVFFSLQLFRYLWWIIQTDATNYQFEKIYIIIYCLAGGLYALLYWLYESEENRPLYMIIHWVPLLWIGFEVFQIIYQQKQLKYYHEWVEAGMMLWLYFHFFAGNLWALIFREKSSVRMTVLRVGMILFSLGNIVFWGIALRGGGVSNDMTETALFLFGFVQFFPAVSVASVHLKFGKVSLVLTRTMQFLILFATVLFISLFINQLFGYFIPGNPYRQIMEIIADIILVITARSIYLSNESSVRKYFILSQQQKEEQIRLFSAQVPQFTSIEKLHQATLRHIITYLETENVSLWWKGDLEFGEQKDDSEFVTEVFHFLEENQMIWSANKEVSSCYLPQHLEIKALQYALIFPVLVNNQNYGLLLIGKKKNSVYNLTDIEVIGSLLQQIRLTLNVLHLVQREKDLLAQTFQANLTVLRSQINPHFLFNTLNTISALIHESPDLAEQAVEKLAFIFRYTLKTSHQNFVPFSGEMKLVRTYLDIEQIRFGERLKIEISIEKEAEEVEIPAFVIQTIIENCIKHGIAKIVAKGIIRIDASVEKDLLWVRVYDNGPGIDPERIRKGTGLNNIITRMENLYHSPDTLTFENTGEGTLVTLRVPVSRTDTSNG